MPLPSDLPSFPLQHVASIAPRPPEATWLVDRIWTASGVGIVGGLPKCFKTWLAAELALAIAGGGKALGRFEAKQQGAVVVFAAEDDGPAMRARFEAIALARGENLANTPLFLLDTPSLRLDDPTHFARLRRTIADARARMLILDPFVRIARVDENSAQEVSGVLGSLRELQREHDVAVLVVHHMRKSPSADVAQQLRGSSDFAAWSDSGLFLVRQSDSLVLTAEHRSAPPLAALRVRLELQPAPHLVADEITPPGVVLEELDPIEVALVEHLRAGPPRSALALRDAVKARKASVLHGLQTLQTRGLVTRSPEGWRLAKSQQDLKEGTP